MDAPRGVRQHGFQGCPWEGGHRGLGEAKGDYREEAEASPKPRAHSPPPPPAGTHSCTRSICAGNSIRGPFPQVPRDLSSILGCWGTINQHHHHHGTEATWSLRLRETEAPPGGRDCTWAQPAVLGELLQAMLQQHRDDTVQVGHLAVGGRRWQMGLRPRDLLAPGCACLVRAILTLFLPLGTSRSISPGQGTSRGGGWGSCLPVVAP